MKECLTITSVLHGKRFDDHVVPLSVLKCISTLDGVIKTTLKDAFFIEYPEKKRLSKGFYNGFSLNLAGISEGSAALDMQLDIPDEGMLPKTSPSYKIACRAQDNLCNFIDAANSDVENKDISDELAGQFSKLGESLGENEWIEFRFENGKRIRFDSKSRAYFFKLSTEELLSERKQLRGVVSQCDGAKNLFTLELPSGVFVQNIKYSDDDFDVLNSSFSTFKSFSQKRVLVDCLVKLDKKSEIKNVDEVEQITLLDALDIPSRLEEFAYLKPGWLDGDGEPFDIEVLRKLAMIFSDHYPFEKYELPYTFPSDGNRIVWEWEHGDHSISLYVALETFDSEWFDYNINTDEMNEKQFNLLESESWTFILNELAKVYTNEQ